MTKLSRFALVFPVAMIAAWPASATQWFDFSLTFGPNSEFVFAGRSANNQDQVGQQYAIGSSVNFWTLNGQGITMINGSTSDGTGLVATTGGSFSRGGDTQLVSFNDATNRLNFWNPAGTSSESIYFLSDVVPGGYVFVSADGERMRFGDEFTAAGRPNNQASNPNFADSELTLNDLTSSVEIVPEINGSGLAMIAFTLGTLGLWVYAGGVTGRREEVPAA